MTIVFAAKVYSSAYTVYMVYVIVYMYVILLRRESLEKYAIATNGCPVNASVAIFAPPMPHALG